MPGSAYARPSPGTPISPTQALCLRAQPGQRGCGKGASGPPPPPLWRGRWALPHPSPTAGSRQEKCLLFPGAKRHCPSRPGPRAQAALPGAPWSGPSPAAPPPTPSPLLPSPSPLVSWSAASALPSPAPPSPPATCGLQRGEGTGVWELQGPGLSTTSTALSWSRAWCALSGWEGGPKPKQSGVWGRVGQAFLGQGGGGARVFFLRVTINSDSILQPSPPVYRDIERKL